MRRRYSTSGALEFQTIFEGLTPASPDENNGGPITLGTAWRASVAKTCWGVEWMFPLTTPGAVTAALWAYVDETNGTLLASAVFAAPVLGQKNRVLFATPQAIAPAPALYVVSVSSTTGRYVSTIHQFDAQQVTNGDLTAVQDGDGARNGRFHDGAGVTYPEATFGGNGYFPDPLCT